MQTQEVNSVDISKEALYLNNKKAYCLKYLNIHK